MSQELKIKIVDSDTPSKKVQVMQVDKKRAQLKRDMDKLKAEFGVFGQSFVKAVVSLSKTLFYAFSVLGSLLFIYGKKVKDKDKKRKDSLEDKKNGIL